MTLYTRVSLESLVDTPAEPTYTFPTHADFHRLWPELAHDLIVAEWRYGGAWLRDGVVEEIDVELLDPPLRDHEDWHYLYAEELERFPALHYALIGSNPVAAVARRAGLPANELDVFRMWTAGDSERAIAAALGKSRLLVRNLMKRARIRILEWLVRGGHARLPT